MDRHSGETVVKRHRLFETVTGKRADTGFYVLAQKAGGNSQSSVRLKALGGSKA